MTENGKSASEVGEKQIAESVTYNITAIYDGAVTHYLVKS
jgi:hypothetical protein